jgi:hypothetical protein
MHANRALQESRIRAAMARGVDDYPLVDGLRDVLAYYRAGTVITALESMDAHASRAQSQAERVLETKRGVTIPRTDAEIDTLLASLDGLQAIVALFARRIEEGRLDRERLWELHHRPPLPDTPAAQTAIRSRFPGTSSRLVEGQWRVAERHRAHVHHAVLEQIQNMDPTPGNLAIWRSVLLAVPSPAQPDNGSD